MPRRELMIDAGFAVPRAHADTTIGVQSGAGPNAGQAVRVKGDRHANDITITLSRVRSKRGVRRFTLKVVDRRGRVRGCPALDRHAVLCRPRSGRLSTPFSGRATIDTVKSRGGVAPVPAPAAAVPDGLAGIPSDEDGEGFAPLVAADTVDGGSGDDVLDVDNKSFSPYAGVVVGSAPGPADRLSCGDGSDRVGASASQLVPAGCEGSRFLDAAGTVALRPTLSPDGSLVYGIPCPARTYFRRPIGVCDGTLTLTRAATRTPLGSASFSAKGAAHAVVVVTPASPVTAGELVAVQITGVLNRARPDDTFNQFDFRWATTF